MADEKKKGDDVAAKSAADEARERARQQREAQGSPTAADAARAGDGDKIAPSREENATGEQTVTLTGEQFQALMSRMASMEAMVSGAAAVPGPAADAAKSTVNLAPSAVNSPQHAVRAGGVTSAPDRQPIAKAYLPLPGALPDVLPGHLQPRVEGVRVLLTKPFYYMDAIRNEGEVLEDYTGPLGSMMVVVDEAGRPVKNAA